MLHYLQGGIVPCLQNNHVLQCPFSATPRRLRNMRSLYSKPKGCGISANSGHTIRPVHAFAISSETRTAHARRIRAYIAGARSLRRKNSSL